MKKIRAIILAAGRGSRMGVLTNDIPKCLLKINNKPLIEHQLSALHEAGIEDVAVVTGYKSECLRLYGTKQFHNPQWESTNMVYSLLCAKEWLLQYDCIVSYSDIFYDFRLIKDLTENEDDIAITYDPNWLDLWGRRFANPLDDAETFRLNDQNILLEIGQKARVTTEIEGQYMGLLKFKNKIWNDPIIKDLLIDSNKLDMTSFLNRLILNAKPIRAVRNDFAWGECDSEVDLGVFSR